MVRLPLFMSTRSEKNRSFTRLDSQIATFTATKKLQDLENSISYRRAKFGKFQILPARFGKFKTLLARLGKFQILPARFGKFQTLPARFGKFRSCRQDFENLDLAARFGKFKILQLTRVKSLLLTYHLVKLHEK